MGSIIGHRIDYNGVGALRGQRHIPSKKEPKYSAGVLITHKNGDFGAISVTGRRCAALKGHISDRCS